ncbi:hypothetical protein [Paraburkholderia sp. RAU2J]|uniref:hypothetical protein n=1 Tax=Paraburkholderia sp. RAU2J TaxID=1938810 RepID=UPI0011C4091C|nr:hypothetical protein [Paraburkholderia sp. RAU2J]
MNSSQTKSMVRVSVPNSKPAHCSEQRSRQRCENEDKPETDALHERAVCVAVSGNGLDHESSERHLMRTDVRQIGVKSGRSRCTQQIELALRFERAAIKDQCAARSSENGNNDKNEMERNGRGRVISIDME